MCADDACSFPPESVDPDAIGAVNARIRDAFLAVIECPRDAREPLLEALVEAQRLGPSESDAVRSMFADHDRGAEIERALCAGEGAFDLSVGDAEAFLEPVSREIPGRLGFYRIDGVLARHGRSAVLLATQERPIQRPVAVKLLFVDATSERLAARVALERQILATLEHPSITRIYDSGVDPLNRPFIVMEYVRGATIDAWAAAVRPDSRALVRLFVEQLCPALRFAHGRGVLHCDLSPANVLVETRDDVPHLKVIDFGIARSLGGAVGVALEPGDALHAIGTLRSLAPEAIDHRSRALDVRADVYGLGLLLLELLAGRRVRAEGVERVTEVVREILEVDPPLLRSVGRVPGADSDADLEAIVARAVARDPARRYPDVGALASDLEHWLRGDEVAARPRTAVERMRRRAVRWRWPIGALVAAMLGVSWIPVSDWRAEARLRALRTEATLQLERARALRERAGEVERREALVGEALRLTSGALLLAPEDAELLEVRACALEEHLLPRLERMDYRSRESVGSAAELVAIRRRLVEDATRHPRALERLSVALAYQSDTMRGQPEFDAIEAEQLALDERLYREFPEQTVFADNLCWTYQRVAYSFWVGGDQVRVRDCLRRAGALADEVLRRHPDDPTARFTSAAGSMYEGLGELLEQRETAAAEAFGRARARAALLLEVEPMHRRGAAFLLRASVHEARLALERGDTREAEDVLAGAIDRAGSVIRSQDGFVFLAFPLIDALQLRAEVALARGDLAGADRDVAEAEAEIARERATLLSANLERLVTTRNLCLRLRCALRAGSSPEVERLVAILRPPPGDAAGQPDTDRLQAIAQHSEGVLADASRSAVHDGLVKSLLLEVERRLGAVAGADRDPAPGILEAQARLARSRGDLVQSRVLVKQALDAGHLGYADAIRMQSLLRPPEQRSAGAPEDRGAPAPQAP